jgi:hypothetical protein
MSVKRLKAKSSKPAASAAKAAKTSPKARKAQILRPDFSPEEVHSLEQQLVRHQQSERAWQSLTSPPDGEDRWSEVEEHLLHKDQQNDHAERRWKYFAK